MYVSYDSCFRSFTATLQDTVLLFSFNNVIINDKLIIILSPSDAGGNNESDGIKKSFSLKMRVTIVVSETDDIFDTKVNQYDRLTTKGVIWLSINYG